MTTILYYTIAEKSPVEDFINSLSIQQIRKVTHIFRAIQTYGLEATTPHIRKVTNTPFYELRILGTDNIRLFYICCNNTVIILHGCIKKTHKTSSKDLSAVFRAYRNLEKRL